jgi:hypothetical protein
MATPRHHIVKWYSDDQICAILRKARELGMDMGEGSPVERLTISQLEALVNFDLESLDA